MKIELKNVKIRELFEGFVDNANEGVVGYGGRLNIRPPYQREFIYSAEQQRAVIHTVLASFPLNVMYYSVEGENFELIDGQQRTLSICNFLNNTYFVDYGDSSLIFANFPDDIREKILDYELSVYFCTGTNSEKLEWFKTINIAGEKLSAQELRNAVYSGPFVTEAKKKFSRTTCVAERISKNYVKKSTIRQELLETAISWLGGSLPELQKEKDVVAAYMGVHQHDPNADELWTYFQNVINWVELKFTKVRAKEMQKVNWGELYNEFHTLPLDAKTLEDEIQKLMADSDVQKKDGIYRYVLDHNEKHLNIRSFDDNIKRSVYERQQGHCANSECPKGGAHVFEISEMEADHITPWHAGGRTIEENCQMLCRECNRRKSGK